MGKYATFAFLSVDPHDIFTLETGRFGAPQPATPEGTSRGFVSPDGKAVLALSAGGQYFLYPIASGSAQKVPGLTEKDIIIRWSLDGRSVLVFRMSGVPARIEAVNLSTGRRTFLRELAPAERAGVLRIRDIAIADNGKSYAYSYYRNLARLAIVDGVK